MVQEADREIHELLAWMRQDGGSSDEEGDMLLALAEQAGPTPKSQTQRSSQQVSTLSCDKVQQTAKDLHVAQWHQTCIWLRLSVTSTAGEEQSILAEHMHGEVEKRHCACLQVSKPAPQGHFVAPQAASLCRKCCRKCCTG